MNSNWSAGARRLVVAAAACTVLSLVADAQTPPAGDESVARANQAIKTRKAVFTLIGANFGPIGAVLQGKAPFDGTEALKRAERVSFLAALTPEVFPDISKNGDTKAKPEIWENRAAFDKHGQDLIEHANALVTTLRKDKNNVDTFKTAATALAADCKGCHDDFKAK